MKITVITGSPRINGTSNYMANEFIKGAEESWHEVFKFDSAKSDVKNCIACNSCEMGLKACIHNDNFVTLKEHLLDADVIVFVTPIYYYGMTSSLKKIIDRFYSIDLQLKTKKNKSILITVQHASNESVKDAINMQYHSIINWLQMENAGIINAIGIESVEQLIQTEYPKQAYQLGKNL